MNINNIFSSFLAIDMLSVIDNNDLIRYAHEQKENNNGVVKSNYRGWQSDTLTDPNSQIDLLVKEIITRAEFLKSFFGFSDDYVPYLNNLWININKTSCFNRPHIHLDSVLSGTYYVDCSDDSGQLVFLHPSLGQRILIDQNSVNSFTEYSSSIMSVPPEVGKLVIFPSWLEHYVEPNISEKERISIAFNISFGKKI
jgi:uncharacterized protein (TIGR02466 family)